MAEKGYLLSQRLLNQVKETHQTVARLPNKATDRYLGTRTAERFLVKVTAKYTGSDWAVPNYVSYSGVQVMSDSDGDPQTVTNGLVWGDETDSASISPIIDINSIDFNNLSAGGFNIADVTTLKVNDIIEVFQKGDIEGDTIWYCLGHEYEDVYSPDSGGLYTSEHIELAIVDSGWTIGEQSGKSGVIITVQTGTSYYHDSTEDRILYAYYRDFTYNAQGQLLSMSVERRSIIDDPTACA